MGIPLNKAAISNHHMEALNAIKNILLLALISHIMEWSCIIKEKETLRRISICNCPI